MNDSKPGARVLLETVLQELGGAALDWWPDALIVTDGEGRIVFVNDTAMDALQYSEEELLGQPVELLIPRRYQGGHADARAAYTAAPSRRRMGSGLALFARRRDGTEFPVDISLAPVEAAGRRFVICSLRDMMPYRQLEDSLRFSESRYRNIVEGATEVFYQVRVSDDPVRGTVTYVSQRALALTGFPPEAFLKDAGLWASLIHPEDFPSVAAATFDLARTGEATVRVYRLRGPSGDYRWIEDHVMPMLDEHGHLRGYHGAARDITERREADLALAEAQERLELAVGVARVGFWDWNLGTEVVHFSAAWSANLGLTAADPAPVIGSWRERLHPDEAADVVTALHLSINKAEAPFSRHYRLRHADGTYRHVIGSSDVLRDDRGHPLRLLTAEVDVTEQVETREQFAHLQRLDTLGRFSPNVLHDLRNLLYIAMEGTVALRQDLADGRTQDLDRDLASIERGSQEAHRLVQGILDFARAERHADEPGLLDLWEVVDGLRQLLPRLVSTRIGVELRRESEQTLIRGHRAEIEHALLNLVANARDAMPAGGQLVLAVRRAHPAGDEPQRVVLEIADSGVGMSPDVQARIFEPYFTTKSRGQGTGLGLSTVRALTTRYSAGLEVESAPGSGTTIRILFPAATAPGHPSPSAAS